jgi:hypothetical protein
MDRRRRSLIRLQVLGGIRFPIRIKKVEPCKNLTAWRNSFATDIYSYFLKEYLRDKHLNANIGFHYWDNFSAAI